MIANDTLSAESQTLSDFAKVMAPDRPLATPRIAFDPEDVKTGLGKLVLTIINLLRDLLERQAIHRMEAGSLTDEETERIGKTFLRLAAEIERLKKEFGLEGEELNLDLGPLGKLL